MCALERRWNIAPSADPAVPEMAATAAEPSSLLQCCEIAAAAAAADGGSVRFSFSHVRTRA